MADIKDRNSIIRLQRSELAVPGSSTKFFEKAYNSNADCILLDLEDSISPNDVSCCSTIIPDPGRPESNPKSDRNVTQIYSPSAISKYNGDPPEEIGFRSKLRLDRFSIIGVEFIAPMSFSVDDDGNDGRLPSSIQFPLAITPQSPSPCQLFVGESL